MGEHSPEQDLCPAVATSHDPSVLCLHGTVGRDETYALGSFAKQFAEFPCSFAVIQSSSEGKHSLPRQMFTRVGSYMEQESHK